MSAEHHDLEPARGGTPSATSALPDLPATLRPHRNLLTYYALTSLLVGPVFFVKLLVGWFRFHTLVYEVDAEGITMRWGILFRREVSLTYARIQDIHLTSNVLERWLGLARIQVQTASGSARAEMTIEGLPYFEALRDFLYARMRGRRAVATPLHPGPSTAGTVDTAALAELTSTLREVANEVRALRETLRSPPGGPHGH